MFIELYSDGSATVASKPGGYGWVMVIDGQKQSEGAGHMEKASNNDAELRAAVEGLSAVKLFIENTPIFPDPFVTLVSDSQLVLGWANGTYQFRQQDKIEKFQQLQMLVKLMNVKTRWIEGHSGQEHNERCDKLANQARLGLQNKEDKIEAILTGDTLIGTKKIGVISLWYKDTLKIIDLDNNIIENYNRDIHGTRGTLLEIREDKNR
jgi:ribonuclease HI